jgi:hypothetical protein
LRVYKERIRPSTLRIKHTMSLDIPHQTTIKVDGTGICFSSDFDSGNLLRVERRADSTPTPPIEGQPNEAKLMFLDLWVGTDVGMDAYRTWFHFNVSGVPAGTYVVFTVMNSNDKTLLYDRDHDYRPVFRSHPAQPDWTRVASRVTTRIPDPKKSNKINTKSSSSYSSSSSSPASDKKKSTPQRISRVGSAKSRVTSGLRKSTSTGNNKGGLKSFIKNKRKQQRRLAPREKSASDTMEVSWAHFFSRGADEVTDFAFCWPHSYTDMRKKLRECAAWAADEGVRSRSVHFREEVLCHSALGREVPIVTITSGKGYDPHTTDTQKEMVFVSARVHPGETPSSHMLNGFLDQLLHPTDPRAYALLSKFVFKIVPMVNPDGVAIGNYRTDHNGTNLNRVYDKPDPTLHPTVHAIREYVLTHQLDSDNLWFYLDLHAHANKHSCFIFGNALKGRDQVQNILYPKLVGMNSPFFNLRQCVFSESNMKRSDKKDGLSKAGSGRVALYRATGLVHCYVCEVNYNYGKVALHGAVPPLHQTAPLQLLANQGRVDAFDSYSSEEGKQQQQPKQQVPRDAEGKLVVGKASPSVSGGLVNRRSSLPPGITLVPGITGERGDRDKEDDEEEVVARILDQPSLVNRPEEVVLTPAIFESLGAAMAVSIADLRGCNPHSRVPQSEYGSLGGIEAKIQKAFKSCRVEPEEKLDTDSKAKL